MSIKITNLAVAAIVLRTIPIAVAAMLCACLVPAAARADSKSVNPLGDAMTAMEAAVPVAAADKNRPVYHFHAPAQWMNDANGFTYYDGWYHMFYQSNPYGSGWGNMHWGHARSRDLVNWEQLPIAIYPSFDRGEGAIFTGSILDDISGRPRAFYTSINSPDNPRSPEVWCATPADSELIKWNKLPNNPVISEQNMAPVYVNQWRDPFLIRNKGVAYLVTGGEIDNRGVVVLYKALNGDLTSWQYLGPIFRYPDDTVSNIECPNFFNIGDAWVLLVSVHHQLEYFTGSADLPHCAFTVKNHGVLEYGTYASQVTDDPKGRTLEFAWVGTIGGKGWAGCLTLPNVLSVDSSGVLIANPISNLKSLHAHAAVTPAGPLSGDDTIATVGADGTYEADIRFSPGTATEVGLRLPIARDGLQTFTVSYNPATSTLSVPGMPHDLAAPVDPKTGCVLLQIFVDRALVDIYVNGGQVSETGSPWAGQPTGPPAVVAYAKGGTARIARAAIYEMRPATIDMSRFH
jgi:beta-fructofuranosidase